MSIRYLGVEVARIVCVIELDQFGDHDGRAVERGQGIVVDGVTGTALAKDGAPVDVEEAVWDGDGSLDGRVTDDAPHPVVLVTLGRRVGDGYVGHSDLNRPIVQAAVIVWTTVVDGHGYLK